MLTHPRFLKTVLFGTLLWRSTGYISYMDVMNNAPSIIDVGRDMQFAQSALMRTEMMSIVLVLSMMVVFSLLLRDFIRRTA